MANPIIATSAPTRLSRFAAHPAALASVLLLIAAILVTGCSKPVEKAEEIRPVRAVQLTAEQTDQVAEFSGDVRARIESRLGFRVPGKVVARKVEVGTIVTRGQVLMQLDPQDLQLAQLQASSGLKAAASNRDLALAELRRYQDLRERNFVSQAVLDSKQTAFDATQAGFEQAQAAYRNQSNQAGYASLVADADGVVTAIDAEVGQVVSAGAPVVRVAQAGDMDVVIGIPEDKLDLLRRAPNVHVRLWALPNQTIAGRIREVSPVADPATRTYTAKVAIPNSPARVKLGMSATVAFAAASQDAAIRLPLSALFRDKAASAVWVVEQGSVRRAPMRVVGNVGNDVLVEGGIEAGQTVVTAGVNLLKPGQKVKLLEADAALETRTAQAATMTDGAAK